MCDCLMLLFHHVFFPRTQFDGVDEGDVDEAVQMMLERLEKEDRAREDDTGSSGYGRLITFDSKREAEDDFLSRLRQRYLDKQRSTSSENTEDSLERVRGVCFLHS